MSAKTYKVTKAPRRVPPAIAAKPARRAMGLTDDEEAPLSLAAAEEAAEPIAPVAWVYTDPPHEVTTPAPDAARVIALPPSSVTTVYTDPATATMNE